MGTVFALRQHYNDGLLVINSIVFSLSIGLINFAGITVTKIASAGNRSITEPIRTITIWAFFMLPIVNPCHRERFNWIQCTGFLFLIAGNLIYNEIVKLPVYKTKDEVDLDNFRSGVGSDYQSIPLPEFKS